MFELSLFSSKYTCACQHLTKNKCLILANYLNTLTRVKQMIVT